MDRFNVQEWRRVSMLKRAWILLTCRHPSKRELAAIPHRHDGDDYVESDPAWMTAVIVEECNRCGHISARHVGTLRDRSPGAMQRYWEARAPKYGFEDDPELREVMEMGR